MASRVDFCQVFQTAYDFGITQNGEVPAALPANIIGSSSASPLEVASAFGAIANRGQLCTPMSILTVTDRDEDTLKEYEPSCAEIVSPTVADQVATLLTASAGQYYTSTRLSDGRPFAAKLGTTDGNLKDKDYMLSYQNNINITTDKNIPFKEKLTLEATQ